MDKSYKELIREVTKVNRLYSINEDDIFEILYISKALMFDGHFELLSNIHTDVFLRFALIAQYPWLMSRISKEMLEWIDETRVGQIDVVLGTSRAGKWFAYDIARELNGKMRCRAVYAKTDTETGYPMKELLDGFIIRKKERVLIVNDLTTTGTGLCNLIDLAESYSAEVVGICVFASRPHHAEFLERIENNYNFHSIVEFDMQVWDKNKCPLCNKGMEYVKSMEINSLTHSTPLRQVLEPLKRLRVA